MLIFWSQPYLYIIFGILYLVFSQRETELIINFISPVNLLNYMQIKWSSFNITSIWPILMTKTTTSKSFLKIITIMEIIITNYLKYHFTHIWRNNKINSNNANSKKSPLKSIKEIYDCNNNRKLYCIKLNLFYIFNKVGTWKLYVYLFVSAIRLRFLKVTREFYWIFDGKIDFF